MDGFADFWARISFPEIVRIKSLTVFHAGHNSYYNYFWITGKQKSVSAMQLWKEEGKLGEHWLMSVTTGVINCEYESVSGL